MLLERTHYCAQVGTLAAGEQVIVAGWVRKRRDLGHLVFVDLYDRTGILQVVFDPERTPDLHRVGGDLGRESVITVSGTVSERPVDALNPSMATGQVELIADRLTVHSTSKVPPIHLTGGSEANEELRLKYRYLDLRRPEMFRIIDLRHRTSQLTRSFYSSEGFIEVTTPYLMRSTPEGARDFLVPSRLHKGMCYALPQSPQMLKQILMISGVDRYFQIVKCFRDEDSRADRQPEFSQIDVEMSFTRMDTLFDIHERLMQTIFKEAIGVDIPRPFQRMTWKTAMERYGSDKPDLRFGLEIRDITRLMIGSGIGFIDSTAAEGGVVRALVYPGGSILSRKQVSELEQVAKTRGAAGMIAVKVESGNELSGGAIGKMLSSDRKQEVIASLGANAGDLLCIVAGNAMIVANSLGAIRLEIARREKMMTEEFRFLWVTEFPLLEYNEEDGRFYAMHHPFTSPMDEDIDWLDKEPGRCRAKAYDLVLNGIEIGGGSVRIHRADVQTRMFDVLGINACKAEEQFGFFLEALRYGTPPHCGIAFGLDRLVMTLAGTDNLRDVIAFPKTLQAVCMMTQAPSSVTNDQLNIVGLQKKSDKNDKTDDCA
ncbi:aspartate--tRNA ligase [bacterium]|nr:aspartate--tRNA ligase [candidate division CSSED10-310 bacterium]